MKPSPMDDSLVDVPRAEEGVAHKAILGNRDLTPGLTTMAAPIGAKTELRITTPA